MCSVLPWVWILTVYEWQQEGYRKCLLEVIKPWFFFSPCSSSRFVLNLRCALCVSSFSHPVFSVPVWIIRHALGMWQGNADCSVSFICTVRKLWQVEKKKLILANGLVWEVRISKLHEHAVWYRACSIHFEQSGECRPLSLLVKRHNMADTSSFSVWAVMHESERLLSSVLLYKNKKVKHASGFFLK